MFIVFISLCCIDFTFHALVGLFDFFGIYKDDDAILPDMPTNRVEASLGVAIFCVLALFVVFPLWYVQITNLISNRTTYQRFAFTEDFLSDDVKSMMLQENDEWAPSSVRSSREMPMEENEQMIFYYKCNRRKNLMKINDTGATSGVFRHMN
jgi:hypothetical protein